MNLKFNKQEKINVLIIIISTISLITSTIFTINNLSWIPILLCGTPIFKKSIKGLITEFDIKADVLVSIGIIASILIGELFAAGEIATIMAIGRFIEEYTISKTHVRNKELINITSSKPENTKIVKTANKWATLIVAIAFTVAILTYLYTFEIMRSITTLIVFCPCALILSPPTSIIATIGNLTKYGILIKDSQSIEEMAHVDEVIFDKTGTLTKGTFEIVNINSDNPQEMMYLLSSLESKSQQDPIAKSINKYYNNSNLGEVNNFKKHIGKGVSGNIDGHEIIAGNKKFMESENISLNNIKEAQNGEIQIYVAKNGKYIGNVCLADTIRENSKKTIRRLKGLRIKTTLLTGDNEKTANYIAQQLKIRNVKYNCLPEDKVEYIKKEQMLKHRVAMIGNSINNTSALKKANVGISMGENGSNISADAAKITLINNNIEAIPQMIAIARRTIKVISTGIGFALTLNIIAIGLAILGIINPIEGALIHNIGSVIVIFYSYTLSNYKISKKDCKNPIKGVNKNINKAIT